MKKIYLISLIFVIILSSFTYGALTDNLVVYYTMDDLTDSVGSNDLNINGDTSLTTGLIGDCYTFDGSGDNLVSDNNIGITGDTSRSVSLWVYDTNYGSQGFIRWGTYASYSLSMIAYLTGGVDFVGYSADWNTGETLTTSQWNHLVYTTDDTHVELYINGVRSGTGGDLFHSLTTTDSVITIGDYAGALFSGKIDEVGIWNKILTQSEVTQLYNSGNGLQYPFGTSEPQLFIQTNLINNTINFNKEELKINFSLSELDTGCAIGDEIINSSLYINDVLNSTIRSDEINAYPDYSYVGTFNISYGEIEQNFTYEIKSIWDTENCNISINSGKYKYTIDRVKPIINSNFVNNTIYNQLDTLSFKINFTDKHLTAYNISIYENEEDLFYNSYLENISSEFQTKTISKLLTSLGNYNIIIDVWDSNNNILNSLNNNSIEYFFSVTTASLSSTELNLTGLENEVNNINITMSYFTFWIVFIIILVIPEFNKTNYEILNILRVIFLFILFVTLFNIDYGFTIGIVNLLKLIILILILGFVSIGKDENNTNDTH